jgi:hypothetical protein
LEASTLKAYLNFLSGFEYDPTVDCDAMLAELNVINWRRRSSEEEKILLASRTKAFTLFLRSD